MKNPSAASFANFLSAVSSKMADDDSRKEFDWDLAVGVPTVGVQKYLRVTSNESVGAVMIKLAEKLGKQ